MANDQCKMLLVAKYLIMDNVSLCPTEVLRKISDTLASANEPQDRGAVSEPFKGISVTVLSDLHPIQFWNVTKKIWKQRTGIDSEWRTSWLLSQSLTSDNTHGR